MWFKGRLIKVLQKFNLPIIRLTKEEYGLSLEYDLVKLFNLLRLKNARIVIFDVVANVGSYTILASGHAGADTIAIEPVSLIFKRMQNIIQRTWN